MCSWNSLSLWEQAVILGKGEATRAHICVTDPPLQKEETERKEDCNGMEGEKEKRWRETVA